MVVPESEACANNPCSGHGECITTDSGSEGCQCKEGWRGAKCQFVTCPSPEGLPFGETDECSSKGYCSLKTRTSGACTVH
jgi:hypothetical protein